MTNESVMAGIASYGAYIPFYRLSRAEIARAWGGGGGPGERAVANYDEDSLPWRWPPRGTASGYRPRLGGRALLRLDHGTIQREADRSPHSRGPWAEAGDGRPWTSADRCGAAPTR